MSINVSKQHKIGQSPDLEAQQLWKGRLAYDMFLRTSVSITRLSSHHIGSDRQIDFITNIFWDFFWSNPEGPFQSFTASKSTDWRSQHKKSSSIQGLRYFEIVRGSAKMTYHIPFLCQLLPMHGQETFTIFFASNIFIAIWWTGLCRTDLVCQHSKSKWKSVTWIILHF